MADANTVRRIVRLAGVGPGRRVVEIGAGLGSLTLALAEAGAEVTAVEIDRHVLPVLRAQVEPARGRGWWRPTPCPSTGGDLLGAEPAAIRPWTLVANLPYNVAVPLVIRVLEEAPQVASLLVMVQREVGERLAAGAGDEAYGAVSVKVAYWATAAVVGTGAGQPSSSPGPRSSRSWSASTATRRPRRPATAGRARVPGTSGCSRWSGAASPTAARCCAGSLDGLVDPEAFEAAGVDPTARAEELGLDEWERLAAWRRRRRRAS